MSAVDKDGNCALHHAASNLNYAATRVLLEAGSPLEIKNKDVCMGGFAGWGVISFNWTATVN